MVEIGGMDLDFSERPTQIAAAGVVIGIGALLLSRGKKAPELSEEQRITATLQPPEGLTWSDVVASPENRGVIGNVGTYPTPGPQGPAGPGGSRGVPGTPGTPGSPGQPAKPVKTNPTPSPPATWVKIGYKQHTGYVHDAYLCGSKVCKTGRDGLRLRKTASYYGDVLTVIPDGATVIRGGAISVPTLKPPAASPAGGKNRWLKVTHQGKTGYVAAAYVSGGYVRGTGGDGLRLRSEPSTTGKQLANLPEGTKITAQSTTTGGNYAGESLEPIDAADPQPFGGEASISMRSKPMPLRDSDIIREGESVRAFAVRTLGDETAWSRITTLNAPLNDPIVGQRLRIR